MSRTLALLALVAFAGVAHGATKPGTSCSAFDNTVCEGESDGTFFENPSDCQSPFCHTSYVVCYNGKTTVQNCPEDSVWSQAKKICISKREAPGGCPETCGVLNNTMCSGKADGSMHGNPTDCMAMGSDMPNTFLVCLNETAVVSSCPNYSTYNDETKACEKDGVVEETEMPVIPGYEASYAPVAAPALSELWDDAYAPAPGPSAEGPSIAAEWRARDFSFMVQSKDVLDLSASEIAKTISDATGVEVDAAEPKNPQVTLDLVMPKFGLVLDDDVKQDVSDAVRHLVADALSEYDVSTDDIVVEDVTGAVSTASADMEDGQTVTATVVLTPKGDEKQSMLELAQALPEFDTLWAKALDNMDNTTAAKLGVSSDVAAYLQEDQAKVNDYQVAAEITVSHSAGPDAQQQLKKAVESGELAKELEAVLGEAVMTEEVTMAPAPAPGTREIEFENAAFPVMGGAITAVMGAFLTLALVL